MGILAIDKNVDYGQSGGEPGQVAEGEFAIDTAITSGTFGLAETAPVTPVFLDSVPWILPIAIFENSQTRMQQRFLLTGMYQTMDK